MTAIPQTLQALAGWLVHRDKVPHYRNGKRRSGPQGESADREQLTTYDAALAVLHNGSAYSGLGFAMLPDWELVCIDLDHCLDAEGHANALAQEIIAAAGDTYVERSPSGRGLHVWLRGSFPDRKNVPGGVEVFCGKGYLTMTGDALEGVSGAEIKPLTPEMSALLKRKLVPPRNVGTDNRGGAIPNGTRNTTLTSIAGGLRARGFDAAAIAPALLDANATRCDPPLDEAEVVGIARGMERYSAKRRCTDLGNAERLVDAFSDKLKYCPQMRRWLCWDGARWRFDGDGAAHRAMRVVVRAIYAEAAAEPDDTRRAALAKWAANSESGGRLKTAVELAEKDARVLVDVSDLDADPWKLGVCNGTMNLETCTLLPSAPEFFITKQALVAFDPDARCELWESFLNRIFPGDKEFIAYVQRAVGYSLTGDTMAKTLFFLFGARGDNGKSTLIETLLSLFGDYAVKTRAETFMRASYESNGPAPERVALRGARLVVASELSDRQSFDESFLKDVTGGMDKIACRNLYEGMIQFRPEFKLWLYGNHKPRLRDDDDAAWRRLHILPFEERIPLNEQDHDLGRKLLAELPGILNWALAGLAAWRGRDGGLKPPSKVLEAVKEYRGEMDDMGRFITECCVTAPTAKAQAGELYTKYADWCRENGQHPMGNVRFSQRLAERDGIERRNLDGRTIWHGLGLRF